ncbi:glycosyltransferase family 39 protein [Gammaproteobacteria bacterium]|nr:glycosyltransferase family 39 protein [Gammaproteobacteria bacterium]
MSRSVGCDLTKLAIRIIGLAIGVRFLSLGIYPIADTTEARYGEMARIMVETGNWLTPMFDYEVPFWGKPPLFAWLSALGMQLFGVGELPARLLHFLVGLGCLLLLRRLARDIFPRRDDVAVPLAIAVLASVCVFNVIIGAVMSDAALCFAILLSMTAFWLRCRGASNRWGYLFFVGIAIGLLAKGPLAPVLIGISLAMWLTVSAQWRRLPTLLPWVGGTLLCLAIALPWYLLAERATPGFLDYFIVGEHIKRFLIGGWQGDLYGSAHQRPRGTIWLLALLAALPWTPLFLWQMKRSFGSALDDVSSYLWCWLLAPLLLFSFSGNILATYLLPSAPAFALLMALYHRRHPLSNRLYAVGFVTPLLISIAVAAQHFMPEVVRSERNSLRPWSSETPQRPLYYVGLRPFSAQFYSQGRAQTLDSFEPLINIRTPYYVAAERADASSHERLNAMGCDQTSSSRRNYLYRCDSQATSQ